MTGSWSRRGFPTTDGAEVVREALSRIQELYYYEEEGQWCSRTNPPILINYSIDQCIIGFQSSSSGIKPASSRAEIHNNYFQPTD